MKKPKGKQEDEAVQYAALPYRMVDGQALILLVTSRETRRWVLPKGWPEKKLRPHELAAREAFEEAGLKGETTKKPIGTYRYVKWLSDRTSQPCRVDVYPMLVTEEATNWPEKGQRESRWFTPGQAAMAVTEGGLVTILLSFGAEMS